MFMVDPLVDVPPIRSAIESPEELVTTTTGSSIKSPPLNFVICVLVIC